MTKLNKNHKIAIIVAIAVLAFTAINVCIGYGANADQSENSGGQDITRNGVKVVDDKDPNWVYYRFSEKDGNMGPWILNGENATHKQSKGKWPNNEIWNEGPSLKYGNPDLCPSCSDDFVYHHDGGHFEMYNIHFCIPSRVTDNRGGSCRYNNRITVGYHTETPGDSEDNNFRFYFDVDLMPDGQNVEKTIHMGHTINDLSDDCHHEDAEILSDAGYSCGDSITEALEYVGEPSLYQAIKDHKMVVRVVELRFWS